MEKPLLLTTLFLLFNVQPIELSSSSNKTLLLSPSDLQEIFRDLEKLWTTETNDVLPADPVHGIQLHPSVASIGLVGQKTKIKVILDESYSNVLDRKLIVTSGNRRILRVLTKEIFLPGTSINGSEESHSGTEREDDSRLEIIVLGLKPGRAQLNFQLLWAHNSSAVPDGSALFHGFEVWVVQPVNVLTDALVYVLLSSQVMTLLMLAFRMRSVAVKSILCKPCALLAAVTCQAILMPMVSVGVSVALSLPVHAVVCLLILGCCPTGMLTPILAVLQQAHVELALVLSFLESTMAFGIMPLWFFTYSNFLGLEYDHIAGPYYYLAGALGVVAGPLLLGLLVQRCAPRALPGMDRAIPPTCALMLLVQLTVSSISFANCWEIVTWRLLLGGALVPLCGCVLGVLTTAIFRQRLPQIKTVAIVTGLQNTVLAKVIIQMSYPASDAGIMVVMLTCIDFATLVLMLLTYLPHCCLWFWLTKYRPLHDHTGIGGLDHSLSDRVVKSMIRAGEITFGKLQSSPRLNNLVNAFDYPSARSKKNLTSLGSLAGRQFFTSPFNKLSRNPFLLGSKTAPSTMTSGFSLQYFNGNSGYPGLTDSPTSSQKSDKDSLQSIDYEMLGFRKGPDGFHHADPDHFGVSPCSSFDEVIQRPNVCSRMSGLSYQSSFHKQIISDSERDSGFCAHTEEMSPFPRRSSRLFSVMDFVERSGSRHGRTGNADVFHAGDYPHPPPSPTVDTQDTTVELTSIDEETSYTTSLDRLNQLRRSKRIGADNFNILSY